MGTDACAVLEVEVALDRVEAQLAAELPAHVRAFARSYLAGGAPPAAPDLAGRVSTLAIGRRALAHPVLADRGLALLRLVAPLVIERDGGVSAARAVAPSWPALVALIAARDAAAHARFGRGAIDVLHRLHGADPEAPLALGSAPALPEVPAPIAGWMVPGGLIVIDDAAIAVAWRGLAERHGVTGTLHLERADVRPRAFVVAPQTEVIVAVPRVVATPAARFSVLHELGHAVANLLAPAGLPRVVDEAVASYVARMMEVPGLLAAGWTSPLAAAARARRTRLAQLLDALERTPLAEAPPFAPPWALWHDPGAQAAYVRAEAIADRWWRELGATPPAGALAAAITAERGQIDRATAL